ncbi:hypothetical protein LPB72_00845 [Hydrogenophaga crassostreae]|uniref:VanZ-like domain-containing protein n=1 Tax=Hydrogenophaga crassostreae TaxID=1763535 RepID=A0A170AJA2_9BURK|nr:VanZ family protein [Hydrogenophaga crassostreae]AOW13946.1 hypothetical protein LPB072_14970 [Hydrogenophaga crassostreae]OAD44089.1 hypothetical protein LPB72_00845 [Hydrogenophaga crassostreae]
MKSQTKPPAKLLLVALFMWIGYQIVQWPAMRVLYSAEDKWAHGAAFFAVWFALRWATTWRVGTLALVGAGLGGAVEIHQMFLPGFSPSWADWGADLLGIGLAWAMAAACLRTPARAHG